MDRNIIYSDYDLNNYQSYLQKYVMESGHKDLEKKINPSVNYTKVLEVGCGTGEHLKFVKHQFNEYHLVDENEGLLTICQKKNLSNKKLFYKKGDASNLDYEDNFFDRVIAVHVLEHIHRPEEVIREWKRVIKNRGLLSILIPTDPGIMWRIGKCIGPRARINQLGIPYDYIMALQHVNSCTNLVAIMRHDLPNGDESWWPTKIPSTDINLFYSYNVLVNKN